MYKLIDFENNPRGSIVLGDSRSNGLYHTLDSTYCANMSYGGASIKEMAQTFWWVVENHEIDTCFMGINLNLYNKYNKRFHVEQTIEALNNFISYAFNRNVFRSSFLIIKSQISNKEVLFNQTSLSKEEFWEYELSVRPNKFYEKIIYPENYYEDLIKISNYCNQEDIKLILWIPPTHIDFQNAVKKYNLEELDEHFKSDLRTMGEVYDYNFPSKLTEHKENFRDPLHFEYEIAKLIRDELINGQFYAAKHTEKEIAP